MNMPKATSVFSNNGSQSQGLQMFPLDSGSGSSSHSSSLLLYLSDLKEKLTQLQNQVEVIFSPQQSLPESTITSMNSTIQQLIAAATSIRFTCQQMAAPVIGSPAITFTPGTCTNNELIHQHLDHDNRLLPHQPNLGNNRGQSFYSSTDVEALEWFPQSYNHTHNNPNNYSACLETRYVSALAGEEVLPKEATTGSSFCGRRIDSERFQRETKHDDDWRVTIFYGDDNGRNCERDIIELDAADLLARYTYFCQVCGKGFRRDANLRMHMRAHGDEYKTNEALMRNPMKYKNECLMSVKDKKLYSCPYEGCRWNQKHAKFQPLKSMVSVKNHYKRSHCPKIYMCKRCNMKQFSVLSDLRTHEKHCGVTKWQCSCGTTFSRKDKLMGHVSLFVGHVPAEISGLGGSEQFQALQEKNGGGSTSSLQDDVLDD